jgi:3-dehydroquinate dehydratase-1
MRACQRLFSGMLFVASVVDIRYIPVAREAGADAIELRLDRFSLGMTKETEAILDENDLPLVLTVRSRKEGGGFSGSPDAWRALIDPFLSYAKYVDIEQQFGEYASEIRRMEKTVISSFHVMEMLSPGELEAAESRLRQYGTPKIVVSPSSLDDVLAFCGFTHRATKPIITSIMGERFRFARILLPLFGSEMFFAYAGLPAAEGQFPVREARAILTPLLT